MQMMYYIGKRICHFHMGPKILSCFLKELHAYARKQTQQLQVLFSTQEFLPYIHNTKAPSSNLRMIEPIPFADNEDGNGSCLDLFSRCDGASKYRPVVCSGAIPLHKINQ